MKLLTQEIRQRLPQLYTTQNDPDPVIHVKYFCPWNNWTWYATEFDGRDLFWGLVDGFELEWGYFSLREMESVRGPDGVPAIERDLYFEPAKLSETVPSCRSPR